MLEQEGDGVQLMTVHRAKGLEFPVVILADLTAELTSNQADRFIVSNARVCAQTLLNLRPWELLDPANLAAEQRMNREEGERVAYVAATRARDLLVVSVVGERDRKMLDETWLSPLHEALYPRDDMFRTPAARRDARSRATPPSSNRPIEHGMDDNSVKPGLHYPRRGSHTVVWFDPAALDLGEKRSMGLQYEEVLTGSANAGLELYRTWQASQAEIVARAGEPQFEIERATEAATADSKDVELVRIPKQGVRPAGRAFGKLVHGLLQQAELPVNVRICKPLRGWKRGFLVPRKAIWSPLSSLRSQRCSMSCFPELVEPNDCIASFRSFCEKGGS